MKVISSLFAGLALVFAHGCAVGPRYVRPTSVVSVSYKSTNDLGSWKEAKPLDNVPKGAWWAIFDDEVLNDLEGRAAAANLELRAAVARVDQARAVARIA